MNTYGNAVCHCKEKKPNILLVDITSTYTSHADWHVTRKLVGNWVICVLSGVMDKVEVHWLTKFLHPQGTATMQIHDEM